MSSTPSPAGDEGTPGLRWSFRHWRRSRPFWAGVWTVLAGVEILSIPIAPLSLMIHEGVAGVAGALMGIFLVVLGLAMWLAPDHRVFAGIAALVFAVASLVLSNFGGFLLGFLLGIIGGAMAVSWAPDGQPPPRQPIAPHWDGPSGPRDAGAPRAGGPGSAGSGRPPGPGPGPGPADGGPGPAAKAYRAAGPAPAAPVAGTAGSVTGGGSTGPVLQGARGRRMRPERLRALGVLPAGALLAGAVQPSAAPAPRPATGVLDPPPPLPGAAAHSGPLTLCSLLGGLLAAGGPTATGTGNSTPAAVQDAHRAAPAAGRAAGGAPGLPLQRTGQAQRGTAGGGLAPGVSGLVGAVTGLLGRPADGAGTAPGASPGPARGSAPAAAPGASGAASRARSPRTPAPPSGQPAGTAPGRAAVPPVPGGASGPAGVDVPAPPLPRDGGMAAPMSLLPLHLALDPAGSTAGCAVSVSLGVAPGAAAYRSGVAAARPFRVLTPLLFLTGLTYQGITDVPTRNGPQRVLVFTALRVDIAALRQTAPLLPPSCGPQGPPGRPPFHGLPGLRLPLLDMGLPGIGLVDPRPLPWDPCQGRLQTDAAPWSTTTATGRPVVLLTKVLSGSMLGLLPVTFTPDMPPPLPPGLTLPIPVFFTNVTSYLQLLTADALQVPGLHQSASG